MEKYHMRDANKPKKNNNLTVFSENFCTM